MATVLLLSVDGESADQIKQALEGSGASVTLVHDTAAALQRLAEQQLVILDAKDDATLGALCRKINAEAGGRHPPLLAVAHDRDVETRVRLLEAGADDVLGRPIDGRELLALVEALALRAGSVGGSPPAERAAGQQAPPATPGRVIVFAAAKGGSGTTTLAVNCALVLAEMAPGNVALADLDMLHAQVSTHLDLYTRSSTAQLAREDFVGQPPEVIRDSGRGHPSGLTVFGGPNRPDEGAELHGSELAGLVEALRRGYATVIVDAGSAIDHRSLAVMDRADRVVMPVTPDIPALRLLHSALQLMSEMNALPDKTTFVLNDIYAHRTITGPQIEEHLGVKIGAHVPYDGESFLRAVNEGQPLMLLARRSAAAATIKSLAELAAGAQLAEDAAPPAPPQRKGLLKGILGR